MSEQAEALTFGPQWIRDLSNGTNVCVPPPSPGPTYKLAQFRYGKEEMLALFSKNLQPPNINGELADVILNKDIRDPLAYIPMSEEEQRNSFGSLNSAAVLKMMGRGGQRGSRGSTRGGRGSGRGRSEGGFYRGFSVDETSSKGEDGWQRDAPSRRLSWGENGRGGYSDRGSTRESETSPRGFDSSGPAVRHREPSRALSSGNWRSSESGEPDEDGGGWIVSGSRGSERAEKWRGSGSSRGGWHSQGSREEYKRGEHGSGERWGDSWGRGDRDKNSFDDVPEWSKSDNVFEPDSGTFDSSGAFCVSKEKKEVNDTGQKEQVNDKEQKEDWDQELKDENQDTWQSDHNTKVDSYCNKDDTTHEITERNKQKTKELENGTDIQQEASVTGNKLVNESKENKSVVAEVREEKAADVKAKHVLGSVSEAWKTPVELPHDEVGANLERVAESCIANLDVEDEDLAGRRVRPSSGDPPSASDRLRASPTGDQTKWYYRDPQGQEQGPFTNEEMVEWFHHGYFTMQLSIRRQCDEMYLPLGEVIKRWQRVPFLPGPAPPPITHQQYVTQQTMFMQEQLLRQHYQHLQKQAILQQIQQQQQQTQQQLDQQRQHSDPSRHSPINTSPTDPSYHPRVHSPLSHAVTSHSVSRDGAAEIIWGTEPESSKGSWSPVSNNAAVWDQGTRDREEAQRLEEEKAKQTEVEKREAEILVLKRKEEAKRQILKKQEEERLQREALQRENELKLRRQKEEEEEMRREKERRRLELQKQAETERRKDAAKQEQKQKKESGEQKQQKQSEIREQQKQALMRLQQQQQELQRRELQKREQERLEKQRLEEQRLELQKLEQQRLEQQRLEEQKMEQQRLEQLRKEEENAQKLQRQLQQKRMQSNSSSSRWGSQNAATLSLSEIQEQEEKNRRAHEEKMRELEARQRQLQSTATSHGWADKQPTSSNIKPLKAIQDEQAKQLRTKQSKQALRTQPAPMTSSGAWTNSWSAGNNNVWSGNQDEHEEKELGFWAEAGRVAAKSGRSPPQPQNMTTYQAKMSSTQPVANGRKAGKKATKEEESVRRIFQQSVNNDPFTDWCTQCLTGMATSVDIPTFIAFLKEVESPYEIHKYVRDFLGESNQAKLFAKEFIDRRPTSSMLEKNLPGKPTAAATTATTSTKPSPTAANVVPRGGGGATRAPTEPESKDNGAGNGKNKKKKKQRMQKVDPSILGFSVNAAERVNMGEIQTLEDS